MVHLALYAGGRTVCVVGDFGGAFFVSVCSKWSSMMAAPDFIFMSKCSLIRLRGLGLNVRG